MSILMATEDGYGAVTLYCLCEFLKTRQCEFAFVQIIAILAQGRTLYIPTQSSTSFLFYFTVGKSLQQRVAKDDC